MIKLRLSIEVSLGEVILGVAGLSATVCACQYLITNKKKLNNCLKYDVVQMLKGSKKNNKVSNLVENKLGKDKSDTYGFKKSNTENGKDKYLNKSKAYITPSKKDLKILSECKAVSNSNVKKSISNSDFKLKGSMSESDSNFKGLISENESYKSDTNEGSPGQLKNGIIKVYDKSVELGANLSISNYDLQTVEEKVKLDIKKEPESKINPNPLKNENINVLSKETRKLLNDLRYVLDEQLGMFEKMNKLVNDEHKDLEYHLNMFYDGKSAVNLHQSRKEYQNFMLQELKNESCQKIFKQFYRSVSHLQVKFWYTLTYRTTTRNKSLNKKK